MNFLRLILILSLNLAACFPATAQQPQSPLVESFDSYQQMKRATLFGLQWVSLGPVVNSARVESVQLDPSRPGTIYSAFGSGNLWKTTNNGVTWEPKFENQASHGIGDIALAPSNPNVIYLGTGESLKKARNFTIPGTGVYRSDDGGENWRHLGLEDSWHIGEIAVHPTNPDVALVAVLGHFWSSNPNRGLYRTADGGKTWQHVLCIDQRTGANDVVWAHSNPNVVYASMWENHPGVSGKNSSVHKSCDGGVTWQNCASGLPSGDQVGRIGLAVSHSNANKVYALVDNREFIQTTGAAQVYRSLDGGLNWKQTHESDLLIFSRIGWYFADIYLNPQNDDEVFALGVRLAHSTDGGKSFELVGGKVAHVNPSAASGLHLDHCELWINPENPNHIVLGNDGGLYQSFDKGATWMHFNNLPTGEFYDIAIDQSSGRIFAGAQDDATVYGPANEWSQAEIDQWKYLWIDPWNGGDGCVTQVDPNDPNTVYFSAQEGAFRRKNMQTNRSQGIRPQLPKGHDGDLKFNFVAPLIISPHDSKTLYLAGNYVFKSTNRGDDWSVTSHDLAVQSDGTRNSMAAGAIAESPLEKGLIYVGTDTGRMWVSDDGAENWTDRTRQLPVGYVRCISPSMHCQPRAYVAISGLNYDDLKTHVYCTEDRGETWTSISANLPDEPANVIMEDPFHENILYVGSFRGVYVSVDRGGSWSLLGKNLPACSVADLAIHERERDLIIGTHGRGIYKVNLSPLHELHRKNIAANNKDHLFPIPVAKRPYLSDVRTGLNFRSFEKTPITFWLTEAGKVDVSVFKTGEETEESQSKKATEQPIASFVVSGEKGLNQFRWDLVRKTNQSPTPYFINYKEFLSAGKYRLQVRTAQNTVLEQEFKVVDSESPQ